MSAGVAYPEEPLLTEAIVGFRAWRVGRQIILSGLYYHEEWVTDGPTAARCRQGFTHGGYTMAAAARAGPVEPRASCGCGLHAFDTIGAARRAVGRWRIMHDEPAVVGAVEAWGAVEVHRNGFRAQHARPVALLHRQASADRDTVLLLAERYDVPLLRKRALRRLVAGRRVPPELKP